MSIADPRNWGRYLAFNLSGAKDTAKLGYVHFRPHLKKILPKSILKKTEDTVFNISEQPFAAREANIQGYNFVGAGTELEARIYRNHHKKTSDKEGAKKEKEFIQKLGKYWAPAGKEKGRLDSLALEHDIYYASDSPAIRDRADLIFAEKIKGFDNATIEERSSGFHIGNLKAARTFVKGEGRTKDISENDRREFKYLTKAIHHYKEYLRTDDPKEFWLFDGYYQLGSKKVPDIGLPLKRKLLKDNIKGKAQIINRLRHMTKSQIMFNDAAEEAALIRQKFGDKWDLDKANEIVRELRSKSYQKSTRDQILYRGLLENELYATFKLPTKTSNMRDLLTDDDKDNIEKLKKQLREIKADTIGSASSKKLSLVNTQSKLLGILEDIGGEAKETFKREDFDPEGLKKHIIEFYTDRLARNRRDQIADAIEAKKETLTPSEVNRVEKEIDRKMKEWEKDNPKATEGERKAHFEDVKDIVTEAVLQSRVQKIKEFGPLVPEFHSEKATEFKEEFEGNEARHNKYLSRVTGISELLGVPDIRKVDTEIKQNIDIATKNPEVLVEKKKEHKIDEGTVERMEKHMPEVHGAFTGSQEGKEEPPQVTKAAPAPPAPVPATPAPTPVPVPAPEKKPAKKFTKRKEPVEARQVLEEKKQPPVPSNITVVKDSAPLGDRLHHEPFDLAPEVPAPYVPTQKEVLGDPIGWANLIEGLENKDTLMGFAEQPDNPIYTFNEENDRFCMDAGKWLTTEQSYRENHPDWKRVEMLKKKHDANEVFRATPIRMDMSGIPLVIIEDGMNEIIQKPSIGRDVDAEAEKKAHGPRDITDEHRQHARDWLTKQFSTASSQVG